jgi:uncharacterized protein (TIGR03435 family)
MRNPIAILAMASLHFGLDAQIFEVASVKLYKDNGVGPRNSHTTYNPQGVSLGARTLGFIIAEAYDFPPGRIVGPGLLTKEALWAQLTQGYDIIAKADHNVTREQIHLMLQSLLADRFQLKVHKESKTGLVYQLVIAKDGPNLEESQDAGGGFDFSGSATGYVFRNAEMMRLSGFLSGRVDRTVLDQTGLKGFYNFTVKMPEDLQQNPPPKTDGRSPATPSSGLYAESLKRLGLRLIPATAPVDYLVVDHVERASEN